MNSILVMTSKILENFIIYNLWEADFQKVKCPVILVVARQD